MTQPAASEIPAVGPREAHRRAGDGAILIDVRERMEWDESRIPGAEFKPLSQANSWYADLPDSEDIIFYCRSGNRSGQIVRALIEQAGMSNVTNMSGGILAWAEEGLPVER